MPITKFFGGRILKTGISVFITAFICLALDWPAIFAVITAIVTIEPTASDSIKKGLIRFPASAIGAAYSMLFTALIGDRAITYSLSAVFTIITCHKFRLDAGILVATLTAVNMIPITHDHFFDSFLVRIGTTTVGLVVSTIVNLVVLPPHYSKMIVSNTSDLLKSSGTLLRKIMDESHSANKKKDTVNLFTRIMKNLEKAEQLCQFQREEWKYHRHSEEEMRAVHYEHKKLLVLRQILFHIGNIMYAPIDKTSIHISQNPDISSTANVIASILESETHIHIEAHDILIEKLMRHFWQLKEAHESSEHHTHFTSEEIIIYELLAINDLGERLHNIHHSEWKKSGLHSKNK